MFRSGRVAALAAVSLLAAAGLQGCSNFKQMIGLEPTMPDEFAVESRPPLTIPPDFDLRPPRPGTPRPQEKTAAQLARQDLEKAGPGKAPEQSAALAGGGPPPGGGPNPDTQIAPNRLAGKLLGYDGGGGAGVAVVNRKTSPLKDLY